LASWDGNPVGNASFTEQNLKQRVRKRALFTEKMRKKNEKSTPKGKTTTPTQARRADVEKAERDVKSQHRARRKETSAFRKLPKEEAEKGLEEN